MGALSEPTSGRANPSDPIKIPIGEGATKDSDMAAEIKGRSETEDFTNSSSEEKLTINETTQIADTKVVLTPENAERLEEIKASIEHDKQEAIRDAVIDTIGEFAAKAFFGGGISFGTMFNMATSNSLSNKIDKIEHSMENRELNAERAAVDLGYKQEFSGKTSEEISDMRNGLHDIKNEVIGLDKTNDKLENLSLPENELLNDKVSSFCDAENKEEIIANRDMISDALKHDIENKLDEIRDFNKEHRNDNSDEVKEHRAELKQELNNLNQASRQFENYLKTNDSLTEKLDISNISENLLNYYGEDKFTSVSDLLANKDEILNQINKEDRYLSHAETVIHAEEQYGHFDKTELQELYAQHKEEADALEHLRNVDPGRFDDNMNAALKEHKAEMREIECVYRMETFDSEGPIERGDFERIDWKDDDKELNDNIFDIFGSNNNNFNSGFGMGAGDF